MQSVLSGTVQPLCVAYSTSIKSIIKLIYGVRVLREFWYMKLMVKHVALLSSFIVRYVSNLLT